MGYPSRNQESFDFGGWPDPALTPRPPRQVLCGKRNGLWLVYVPGKPPIYREQPCQADVAFGWELAYWKGQGYYEERNGDLYDRRTGQRLRTGYRELFYQISDGHQLRATLRFLEDNHEGPRFVCYTDEGAAICRHCLREQLRDLTYALRHPEAYVLRVVGTELRYSEPLTCDCCDEAIPVIEEQP